MKTTFPVLLMCIHVLLCSSGCGQSTLKNKYYDDAKALADKVSEHQDHDALKELLAGAQGKDYWARSYSISYLVVLLSGKNVIDKGQIINTLVGQLDTSDRILKKEPDPEQSIQHNILEGLIYSGSDGVAKGLNKIKTFVSTFDDNSITWTATEALGLLDILPQAEESVKVLTEVLLHRTPNESIHNAPRLRDIALKSLAKISEKQPALVQGELEKVLPKLDPEYSKKASELIAQIKGRQPTVSK